MTYRFHRREGLGAGTRRVARELLDDAIERLDGIASGDVRTTDELETHVHEIRKRTKELRGLLRLVRPAIGHEATVCRRTVATAARVLAPLRDAHAVLGTIDDLASAMSAETGTTPELDDALTRIRSGQAALADAAAAEAVVSTDPVLAARATLAAVRSRLDTWRVPDRFGSIEGGLRSTYRDGRRALRAAVAAPSDDAVHAWRTAAKALWYEVRLLEGVAPSVLRPLAASLDDLGDALGDDHDLAVLVAAMEQTPERYGGAPATTLAIEAIRGTQDELRRRAFRLGARVYAERPKAFTARVRAYWRADRDAGKELRTGGLDAVAQDGAEQSVHTGAATVERERKFLVSGVPEAPLDAGDSLHQGYLALDGDVAVRVRRGRGGALLTVKGGSGAARTEVELPLGDEQADALWALTEGRRVEKVRHRVPLDDQRGGPVAELDVFGGALDGLVVVEVEFADDEAMAAFDPPAWFGPEVTDDRRYSNAALAVDGAPS